MRQIAILTASILLGLLALVMVRQPAPAQQKPAQANVERYRVRRVNDTWFILVDTATGHSWGRTAGATQWQDLGTPVK
jgi:hypothetical protein